MRRPRRNRMLVFLAVMGPGVITGLADDDAGGITTYSVAGARYGFDLLWVLVLITFVLAMIQEMGARMGMVTQKGLGELIRENYGARWTAFAISTLFVANLATTVAEFAGLAASLEIFGVSRHITLPIAALAIWLLVVKGSFKVVERVFLVLSGVYITYIFSGIMSHPDWGKALHATILPRINTSPSFLFLAIAVIGTTITPWMQFFLQAAVVDKGVRMEDYAYQKWDVYIGSFLSDLIAFFIVVACAATIHAKGLHIETAADAAIALRPLAGKYAEALFAAGLFSASLLSAAVLPLSTAYTWCETFGCEMSISRRWQEAKAFYGIYTFCILFGAAVVMVPQLGLVDIMVNSQVICGILLPVTLIFMLKLINRKDVMGEHTNTPIFNIAVWAMAVVLILMTIGTIVGTALGIS